MNVHSAVPANESSWLRLCKNAAIIHFHECSYHSRTRENLMSSVLMRQFFEGGLFLRFQQLCRFFFALRIFAPRKKTGLHFAMPRKTAKHRSISANVSLSTRPSFCRTFSRFTVSTLSTMICGGFKRPLSSSGWTVMRSSGALISAPVTGSTVHLNVRQTDQPG